MNKSLYNHGILFVVEVALSVKDERVNTTAIEIFSQFVEVVPTLVREFILKEVESRSSVSNLKSKQQAAVSQVAADVNAASTSAVAGSASGQPVAITDFPILADIDAPISIVPISSVLNIADDFEPVLINYVIRQMMNDPDQG